MTPQERSDAAAAEGRDFLARIVISEGMSILFALGLLWYMGSGRLVIAGLVHRARTAVARRRQGVDSEVARFAGEISRWDHEQAAKSRHPSSGGGCGCDGG